MNIIEAINDDRFFKGLFRDLRTWRSWEVYLKALFGLPILERKDRRIFRQCTGLKRPPSKAAKETFVICGRRSGKSWISSIIAVYVAIFKDWSKYLSPGEQGYVFIIANDRPQAQIIKKYISGILDSKPVFRNQILDDLQWEVKLKNNITISVKTSNFRAVRGYTILCVIAEELSFWRDAETSANPAHEVLLALRPGMVSIPESLLIGISTPYGKFGYLFEQFQEHYGQKNDDIIIWKAPTLLMNPNIDKAEIKRAFRVDKSSAKSEWGGEFREDLEDFLSLELIESNVIEKREELLPMKDIRYFAFCDPSGGRQDSMTLGIAHKNSNTEKIVLDLLRESKPPFSPDDVARQFCQVLKQYSIYQCVGDSYSAEWVASSFRKNGIMYENCASSKSELYLGFLPLLSNYAVELLDNKSLKGQLRALERSTKSGGRDKIDHAPGCRDDVANSCAAVCVLASKTDEDNTADIILELAKRNEIENLSEEEKDSARITRWLLGDGKLEAPEEQKRPLIGEPKTCLTVSEWIKKTPVTRRKI